MKIAIYIILRMIVSFSIGYFGMKGLIQFLDDTGIHPVYVVTISIVVGFVAGFVMSPFVTQKIEQKFND